MRLITVLVLIIVFMSIVKIIFGGELDIFNSD